MFSVFNTRSKKRHFLEEGEPPPKKIITEGDIIIKKLAEKQLQKKASLVQELNYKKDFTIAEEFSSLTKFNSGINSLDTFQSDLNKLEEIKELKSKGLSDNDVRLYSDYKKLGDSFVNKYGNVERSILLKRLDEIEEILNKEKPDYESKTISKTEQEYLTSLKPQSTETKLLKFALENESLKKPLPLPHPMDNLPQLEEEFKQNIDLFSSPDIKKIRRKARNLSNKIENLTRVVSLKEPNLTNYSLKKKSLWDVKERPDTNPKTVVIEKDKMYTCRNPKYYTIKDGEIVEIKDNFAPSESHPDISNVKYCFDEKIPPGEPSNVLFLKNIAKNVPEDYFKNMINNLVNDVVSIKIMTGRMRGLAFIEFEDTKKASHALGLLNGLVILNKPLMAQFGNKKKNEIEDT